MTKAYTHLLLERYEYYLDKRTDSVIRTNESGARLNWKQEAGGL